MAKVPSDWLERLDAADVPCAPVNFPEEIFDNPHVVANGLMLELQHEVVGGLRMPACPVRMSDNTTGNMLPPPALGSHSREVLSELGYDSEAIDGLFNTAVVTSHDRVLEG